MSEGSFIVLIMYFCDNESKSTVSSSKELFSLSERAGIIMSYVYSD